MTTMKSRFELRPYQKECLASIPEVGSFLVCMPTGCGKTVTFSQIPRRGRMLILSHRDELVRQPEKYFDCSFGIEQGKITSHGEEVVSASVQSLVRRLWKFKPDDFDVIVTDECFVGSTLIDGVPIRDIKVGEYVMAYDHKTQSLDMKKVLKVYKNPIPDTLLKINDKLVCTLNHPIYCVGSEQYIPALALRLGDLMYRKVGVVEPVLKIELIKPRKTENKYVYNLEVEGLHNYFANDYLVHNCHHAASQSYRTIYDYFRPRLHLGFTATPNRNDGVGLQDIFQDIIFSRDLKWGIENKYLSNIHCLRINLGVDLDSVRERGGDFSPEELARAVDIENANNAIAKAYKLYAKPPCLIFCTSVAHAENLANLIPGAVSVKGGQDRTEILEKFTAGEIPCITNCMVFTEGTDLPNVQTVIIARPTRNISLYTQMVGRGLRLYPGKEFLKLIDCVGISENTDLCTAPSLIGLDLSSIPEKYQNKIEGNLFDLPEIVNQYSDVPEAWIQNVYYVELWANQNKYNLHGVNYYRMPDGSLVVSTPTRRICVPPEDSLGRIKWDEELLPAQKVFDEVFLSLQEQNYNERAIWDLDICKKYWGNKPATSKQKNYISKIVPGFDTSRLTMLEATQIIQRNNNQPPTRKQIYFLQCHNYSTNNLTKLEAIRLIGKIKNETRLPV